MGGKDTIWEEHPHTHTHTYIHTHTPTKRQPSKLTADRRLGIGRYRDCGQSMDDQLARSPLTRVATGR
jgi:hypothetical protein